MPSSLIRSLRVHLITHKWPIHPKMHRNLFHTTSSENLPWPRLAFLAVDLAWTCTKTLWMSKVNSKPAYIRPGNWFHGRPRPLIEIVGRTSSKWLLCEPSWTSLLWTKVQCQSSASSTQFLVRTAASTNFHHGALFRIALGIQTARLFRKTLESIPSLALVDKRRTQSWANRDWRVLLLPSLTSHTASFSSLTSSTAMLIRPRTHQTQCSFTNEGYLIPSWRDKRSRDRLTRRQNLWTKAPTIPPKHLSAKKKKICAAQMIAQVFKKKHLRVIES